MYEYMYRSINTGYESVKYPLAWSTCTKRNMADALIDCIALHCIALHCIALDKHECDLDSAFNTGDFRDF